MFYPNKDLLFANRLHLLFELLGTEGKTQNQETMGLINVKSLTMWLCNIVRLFMYRKQNSQIYNFGKLKDKKRKRSSVLWDNIPQELVWTWILVQRKRQIAPHLCMMHVLITKNKIMPDYRQEWLTHLAYSWGYGEEYHVWMRYFPNSIAGGNRVWGSSDLTTSVKTVCKRKMPLWCDTTIELYV